MDYILAKLLKYLLTLAVCLAVTMTLAALAPKYPDTLPFSFFNYEDDYTFGSAVEEDLERLEPGEELGFDIKVETFMAKGGGWIKIRWFLAIVIALFVQGCILLAPVFAELLSFVPIPGFGFIMGMVVGGVYALVMSAVFCIIMIPFRTLFGMLFGLTCLGL